MIQNTNYGASKSYVDSSIGIRAWISTYPFSQDDLVSDGGTIYKSLQDNNIGNVPSASSIYWEVYRPTAYTDYNCVLNYEMDGSNKFVCSYAGTLSGATPAKVTGTTPNTDSFLDQNLGWMQEVYVCTLDEDGNERHILNPHDLTKDIYGADTSTEITQYDVMVHMPDCYLDLADGRVAINSKASYGGNRLAHTYGGQEKHDLYIAMYPTTVVDGKSHSFSGQTATTTTTRRNFGNYTRAKNVNTNGWHNIKWAERQLVQAMMMQACCDADIQSTIGQGITSGGQGAIATNGALNQAGWFGGNTSATTAPVKCILENFYGNRWCFIDDIVVDSGANSTPNPVDGVYYADVYAGTNAENLASASSAGVGDSLTDKTKVGRVVLGASATAAPGGQYIRGIDTSATGWGIPNNITGGSSSTYFCDAMWANGSRQDLVLVGGGSYTGSRCGLFAFSSDNALGSSHWAIGSRLAYIK